LILFPFCPLGRELEKNCFHCPEGFDIQFLRIGSLPKSCNPQPCDFMGKESEAAPFYETAISNGLSGEELRGAFLGLGSTYRCLGEYQKSLGTFDKAIKEFPSDRSLKTFRALILYNLGKFSSSVEELLTQLIDTTSDENIKAYEKALRFYSDKLDQTWE